MTGAWEAHLRQLFGPLLLTICKHMDKIDIFQELRHRRHYYWNSGKKTAWATPPRFKMQTCILNMQWVSFTQRWMEFNNGSRNPPAFSNAKGYCAVLWYPTLYWYSLVSHTPILCSIYCIAMKYNRYESRHTCCWPSRPSQCRSTTPKINSCGRFICLLSGSGPNWRQKLRKTKWLNFHNFHINWWYQY